jgi:hypothetical protein
MRPGNAEEHLGWTIVTAPLVVVTGLAFLPFRPAGFAEENLCR